MRLFAEVRRIEGYPRVKHYIGVPPELSGGEDHRHDQGERHAPATGSEVFGVFHAGGRVETDTYRDQQV